MIGPAPANTERLDALAPAPAGDLRVADRPSVFEEKEVLMRYFSGRDVFLSARSIKEELLALKRTVAKLGVIGRNLNQIARAANQGQLVTSPGRDDLKAMLRVCEALRDHVKGLLMENLKSWRQGSA